MPSIKVAVSSSIRLKPCSVRRVQRGVVMRVCGGRIMRRPLDQPQAVGALGALVAGFVDRGANQEGAHLGCRVLDEGFEVGRFGVGPRPGPGRAFIRDADAVTVARELELDGEVAVGTGGTGEAAGL